MRCAALCSMTKSELMKLLNRLVCESWARGSGREGWLRRREPTSFRPVRPFLRSAPSPATSPAFGPFAFYRRLFLSPLAGGGPGRIVEGSADRDAPADASSFSVSLASARVFFLPSRSQSFPCFCRRRSLDSSVLSLLAHALFPSRRLFRFASFTHSILSLSLSLSQQREAGVRSSLLASRPRVSSATSSCPRPRFPTSAPSSSYRCLRRTSR